MTISDHKKNLIKLGDLLNHIEFEGVKLDVSKDYDQLLQKLNETINRSKHYNGWFNRENIVFSVHQWASALKEDQLSEWFRNYDFENVTDPKTIGIVMAGNIPLVGFHDLLCVLITGNKALIRQSSNDQQLLPVRTEILIKIDDRYADRIQFVKDQLKGFDAVIATGSNNTARYFEYYFRNKPSIIRKNRNSIAVITGKESSEDLQKLAEDIFRYYGLGCRNVSKLYVPENYDFDQFFQAIYEWNPIINQDKYANNYDYNKAVYLMSEFKILDNGFLVLKNDPNFGSPIASLFYEYYDDEKGLEKHLQENEEKIQCIVSSEPTGGQVKFGETQKPKLWDYADNVDTVAFLLQL